MRTMLGPDQVCIGICTDLVRFDLVQPMGAALRLAVASAAKASDNARFPLLVFGVGWFGRVGMKAA